MKKKKSILVIISILFVGVLALSFNSSRLVADSGWDTSYDSGSDWDSGSSWDYSSNYNYGSSYQGGGGGSNISKAEVILIMIGWLILAIVIGCIVAFTSKTNKINIKPAKNSNKPVNVTIPGFDEKKFLEEAYQKYIDVQNAWMNINYDELQKLLSDELFNTYKAQLQVLEAKNERNEMNNFELISNTITGFEESDSYYTVKTQLMVKFYDYVVDASKNIIRGNNNRRVIMTYELTFIKSKSDVSNKCPNCGGPLENAASVTCPYCKSTIVCDYHGFVLSKKQAISQSQE